MVISKLVARALPSAILLSILAIAPSSLRADATSDATKAIKAAYAQQSSAFVKGDFATFATTHTPDFYEQDKSGRKQSLDILRQALPMVVGTMKNLKHSVKVQSVKVKDKSATVGATETIDGQLMNPRTNKMSTLHAERTMTDSWIQKSGKWLRKMSKTNTEKQFVDGKPFQTGRPS